MSSVVAIVKSIVGQVIAVSPEGIRRVLIEGDRLMTGEVVNTGAAGAVTLTLNDGRTLDVGRDSQWSANAPDISRVVEDTASQAPSVAELQKAIVAGADPTTDLEAPAAGDTVDTGGSGGGGHSVVLLEETAGAVDPTIGFDTAGPTGGDGLAALQVNASNSPTIMAAQAATLSEDNVATGNVLSNASDADNALAVTSYTVAGLAGTFVAGQSATIAGVGTLALAANGDYTFTPAANYSGTVPTITYTTTTGASSTLDLTVTPVADAPVVTETSLTTREDTPVALGTVATYADNDGSETHTTVISGVPVGATLTDGTHTYTAASGGTGSVDVSNWDLTAISLVPAANASDTITLTVTGTSTETANGSTATTSNTIVVNVTPVADAPVVPQQALTTSEDTPIALGTVATYSDNDGSEKHVTVISGIPVGVVVTDGSHSYTSTATGNGAVDVSTWNLSGISLTPPANSSDTITLTVTGTSTETANGSTASTVNTITVNVNAVADAPAITDARAVVGDEDTNIALGTVASYGDNDGSETHTTVISGIPAGATLTDGTHSYTAGTTIGSVDVSTWNLSGITFNAGTNVSGSYTLTVTGTSTEANGSTDTTTGSIGVTVTPVADVPVINAQAVTTNEDTSIALGTVATYADNDGSENHVTVISGIPVGAVITDGSHSYTATAAGDGAVDVSTWNLSGISLTPPANASDTITLTVTGTSTETANGSTASTSNTLVINVAAVADAPAVAHQAVSGDEDTTVALGAVATYADNDGSETHTTVVSGIPLGATLTDGAHSYTAVAGGDGTVDVSGWNLSAITFKAGENVSGNWTLTVTGTSTENANGETSVPVVNTIDVTINPVADAPAITFGPPAAAGAGNAQGEGANVAYPLNTGAEDSAIKLNAIRVALVDTDGSERITSQRLAGLPEGATLKDASGHTFTATATSGSLSLAGWDLASLSLTPPAHYSGTFSLTVSATSTESANQSAATSTATFDVTVVPVADAAVIVASRTVSGDEDHSIALGTVATYADNDGSERHVTTISGVPLGATLTDGTHSYTAVAGGDGTVDVSTWDLKNISFTATQDASGTYALTVTGTATEAANGATATTSGQIIVTVNPVTDTPTLNLVGQSTLASTDFQEVNAGTYTLVEASKLGSGEWHTDNQPQTVEIGAGSTYGIGTSSQVIELERVVGDASNLYTTVNTKAGATYTVSFDYFVRAGYESTSSIDVLWGGQRVTTLAATAPGMTHYTLNLPVDAQGSERLEFVAGDNTNGVGGLLDNIQVLETRNSGFEDQPILLSSIKAATTDVDGSETLTIQISHLPEGSTLTDGTAAHTVKAGASGTVDVTAWNLDNLTFTAPANANGTYTLTVTATAQDGNAAPESVSQNLIVQVAAVNDAPVITHINGDTNTQNFGNAFIETPAPGETPHAGQGVALIAADLKLSDMDSPSLKGATVVLTNAFKGDSLAVNTGSTGIKAEITKAVDADGKGTITISLSGDATPAQYQAVIRTIAYDNDSQNPDPTTRDINIVIADDKGETATAVSHIGVIPENDAPVVIGSPVSFTEGDSAISIVKGLAISDVDNTTLKKAVVTVSGLGAGDSVAFTGSLPSGVKLVPGDVVNGAQTFTFSGTAPIATYETLISALKFSNATDNPVEGVRHVTVAVTDAGGLDQARAPAITTEYNSTLTVAVVNDAPVITHINGDTKTQNFGNAFIETPAAGETPHVGQGVALIAADLKLTDVDSPTLKGATVVLTNAFKGDSLAVNTGSTGIKAEITKAVDADGKGTITISLTGDATPAQYQAVIRTISYNNDTQNPNSTTRDITLVVTDDHGAKATATSHIGVVPENDAPVVTGSAASFTEGDTATSIVKGLAISDVDNTTLSKAVVSISALGAGDSVAFTGTLPVGVKLVAGEVVNGTQAFTFSGTAPIATYETLISAIKFSNVTDTPVDGLRNVTVTVTDAGGLDQARAPAETTTYNGTLKVTAVDDASVLKADTNTINEDGKATGNVLANDSDVDSLLSVRSVTVGGQTYAAGKDISTSAGTLNLAADGSYTFTPKADWAGTVPVVTYTTNTGSTSTLSITVNPVADVSTLTTTGSTTVAENGATTLKLVANPTDLDGSETASVTKISSIPVGATLSDGHGHSFTATTGATSVDVSQWAVTTLTYTPAAYHNGTDALQVTTTSKEANSTSTLDSVTTLPITITPGIYNHQDGNPGDGSSNGTVNNDILTGDVSGTQFVKGQNYNIAFIVDSSASMGSDTVAAAVKSLTSVFNSLKASAASSGAGTVNVFLEDFDTTVKKSVTVNLADPTAVDKLTVVLNSMSNGGNTNYEDAFNAAANFFKGPTATGNSNATNLTYFITDGEPNTYQANETNPTVYTRDTTSYTLDDLVTLNNYTLGSGQALVVNLNGKAVTLVDASGHVINTTVTGDTTTTQTLGVIHAQGDGTYDVSTTDNSGASNGQADQATAEAQSAFAVLKAVSPTVDAIGINSSINAAKLMPYDTDGKVQTNVDPSKLADAIHGHEMAVPAGNDLISGDSGNDIIFGDSISLGGYSNEGVEALRSYVSDVTKVSSVTDSALHQYVTEHVAEVAKLTGTGSGGADTLNGGEGNDILFGQGGNDILNGGDGNDILLGGMGDNTLTGGAGADTFMFVKGDTGTSTITDFNTSQGDVIDLSDLLSGHGDDLTQYLQVGKEADGTATLLVSSAGKLSSTAPDSTNASTADVSIKVSGIGYDVLKSLVAGADSHIKVTPDHA